MSCRNHSLAAFVGMGLSVGLAFQAVALTPVKVTLSSSTKPVEASGTSVKHMRPFVSRAALTSIEMAAPLNFNVALKMRHFAELQERINHGERISMQEMAARYEPLPADYAAVADWLTQNGLTITRRDSHHVMIFVRGSVAQVAQAMSVAFARVTSDGKDYTAAVTAPGVPATISPLLTGVNGLQPFLHAHKHLMRRANQPNASGGNSSYTPQQIAKAYDATPLYQTSTSSV